MLIAFINFKEKNIVHYQEHPGMNYKYSKELLEKLLAGIS